MDFEDVLELWKTLNIQRFGSNFYPTCASEIIGLLAAYFVTEEEILFVLIIIIQYMTTIKMTIQRRSRYICTFVVMLSLIRKSLIRSMSNSFCIFFFAADTLGTSVSICLLYLTYVP